MLSAFRRSQSARSKPRVSFEKLTEEPVTYKAAHSTVTYGYQTHIGGVCRNVAVLWSKNLSTSHCFTITISGRDGDINYTCRVDLKPWHFWSKKGCKLFNVEGKPVDVYWDLRSAKFAGGPDPESDYYVALVSDDEIVLLLGNYWKKAFKRTKSRPGMGEACLCYKKQNVFSKRSFSTRARFDEGRTREHDIVVEASSSSAGEAVSEMWITVDGLVAVHVKNLQWKFRGNHTVSIDRQAVQVYWDVHGWLFEPTGMAHGLFVFKPQPIEESYYGAEDGALSPCLTRYYPATGACRQTLHDFCLFLYAWKL